MEASQFIATLTGHRDDPGYQPTPEDELRALLESTRLTRDLVDRVAASTDSPTRAVLLAIAVERAHGFLEFAQIRVAQVARQNLVHELPAETFTLLRGITGDPAGYINGETQLPADPANVPTGRLEFKDPAECLQGTLNISHFEARDRLQAADALLPRIDEHGIQQGPRYPKLAHQVREGKARVRPTAAAARRLDKLRPSILARPEGTTLAADIEERIAKAVAEDIPRNTQRLFDRFGDELEDTPESPTPVEVRAKTGIFITKRTRHFTYLNACMLNLDAEIFLSHFAQSDNPRTNAGNRQAMADAATRPESQPSQASPDFPASALPGEQPACAPSNDGPGWFTHPTDAATFEFPPSDAGSFGSSASTGSDAFSNADGLTPPQRHLQTLLNLMRAPNSRPQKSPAGLPTAQIVVYVYLETLLGLAKGSGWSAHGLEIPVGELRRRLCTEGVIPIVLGGQSEILDVGREMRLAPDHMKRAVLARDGGCLYPGCTVPPEHCEFHHVKPWKDGGGTSVDMQVFECTAHHHMIDNGELSVVIHDGLPHLLLPKYLDPEQLPRRNTYWQGPRPTLF
ncbi:HNH endonuclease signature motif containing protein [Paeniglutamicibacter sp. NPDC012692]|uniref:HNH endonuclease signature motif containing protein n=1 Tax=Paeniglutamicibacter sp. NPDC012692 TaxID=3364388 RepID=UPI0036C1D2A6